MSLIRPQTKINFQKMLQNRPTINSKHTIYSSKIIYNFPELKFYNIHLKPYKFYPIKHQKNKNKQMKFLLKMRC